MDIIFYMQILCVRVYTGKGRGKRGGGGEEKTSEGFCCWKDVRGWKMEKLSFEEEGFFSSLLVWYVEVGMWRRGIGCTGWKRQEEFCLLLAQKNKILVWDSMRENGSERKGLFYKGVFKNRLRR